MYSVTLFEACRLVWYVSYILSKYAKCIYCIWNLSKTGLPACDIVYIYCSVVRSILACVCCLASWIMGLSTKLSKDIDRIQKCCLKIIYPTLSYFEALKKSDLVRLGNHRVLLGKWNVLLIHCITCYHSQGFHFSDDIKTDLPFFSSKV